MTKTDKATRRSDSSTANVVVEPIDVHASVDRSIVSFSRATSPAILESSLHGGPYARFTILAADPADRFVHGRRTPRCPFRSLETQARKYPAVPPTSNLPFFAGGWIGHFSYEAGLLIEGIPCHSPSDDRVPLVSFRLYDAAAVFDHELDQWYAVAVNWPDSAALRRPPVAHRLEAIRQRLTTAERDENISGILSSGWPTPRIVASNMTDAAYLERVARAKRYIEAGDIFQVNLTRRFSTTTQAKPVETYLRLRNISPSSHAALLLEDRYAIMSSSPELFLDVRDGRTVTRPIKGTRPRRGDPAVDASARRELATCSKERAELNMIIDLMRNDLGRVCRIGSIRVESDGDIETHPTVFHRVATVTGQLNAGQTVYDLLRATFPGGSVTGCPKIRAMQIIDELEPTERSVYCGSIGYLGLDGRMSLNIAIRTMIQVQNEILMYAGGAIVADSKPQAEHDEVLAKARGMFEATGCRHGSQGTERELAAS